MAKILLCVVLPALATAQVAIVYKQSDAFTEIWNDKGSGGVQDVAFWRVNNYRSEFCSLGDVAVAHWDMPELPGLLVPERGKSGALQHPTGNVTVCL